ncbi:polyphosphate kinase 1 [Gallaecimonas pentaromativorans]|uniref:Polyphosphate kinase n=1 Tax=Gallaecimonas pentaromativorans TaxID=584787 RepID=A0A3N1P9K7_9GAMM|nr:polyphosphate kinase 1 [Gallaecimonas pentaromativorans]MED5524694.1 polyphosphate kinase 1 [Pseudomonadota bacterium]ROQ28684.1 polyphosphate kinase [Gallaecimonas pentaromativorans]
MSAVAPFFEKELSWLSFNERVLQEAADKSVPIVERIRFLGIYSNNMDEFFRVRVADVRRRAQLHEETGQDPDALVLLAKIQQKVMALQSRFDELYHECMMALARYHIVLVNEKQLTDAQKAWVDDYFQQKILRHVAPIIIQKGVDLVVSLKDDATYLVVDIKNGDDSQYAMVEVPATSVPRFVKVPDDSPRQRTTLILLDNILRLCLTQVFKGFFEFDSLAAYSMKMTRDADYELEDEISLSLLEQTSLGLKQRLTAEPVRLVYDREMPQPMLDMLVKELGISNLDAMVPGGRYHNFKDFIAFPNVGRKYLESDKLPPLTSRAFAKHNTVFDAISAGDVLVYYPYYKFRHFTEFVRQAAFDPKVKTIRINFYRLARNSRIVQSLIDAVNNGKQVLAVIELRARFDEAANIEWARKMTEAGIRVAFGIPSLKVHCKLCVVGREENGEIKRYAHIGTGNFHEKTAKIYTDYSLFTTHPELTQEAENVFDFIINSYKRFKFNHLLVSPVNARRRLLALIDQEIDNAKKGLPASITFKINNLVDKEINQRLYHAGQSGVKVRLIVRGMCSLRPGVPGLSENIQAISIVGRFLEHPRVMVFHNNGQPQVFISSADLMTRNLDHRVEVGTPILDPVLRDRILDMLALHFRDTTKARVLDMDQQNQYVRRGNRRKLQSQVAIYEYLKRVEEGDNI